MKKKIRPCPYCKKDMYHSKFGLYYCWECPEMWWYIRGRWYVSNPKRNGDLRLYRRNRCESVIIERKRAMRREHAKSLL